jgi:hypothetical protein
MPPVYGGKYMSRKAVHNWVEKHGKRFADDEEVEAEVRKWLRQQPKDFYAAGFDALVRRRTSVSMLVEDMSRNKYFSRFEYHMLYTLFTICDLFTDFPSYMRENVIS